MINEKEKEYVIQLRKDSRYNNRYIIDKSYISIEEAEKLGKESINYIIDNWEGTDVYMYYIFLGIVTENGVALIKEINTEDCVLENNKLGKITKTIIE